MKVLFTNALRIAMLTSLLLAVTAIAPAQDQPGQQSPAAGDNTKVNQRDQGDNQPTADQQQNNQSDRQLTQQIRRSIMQDKSLSTNAHNVKIISQDGKATLKGPVSSENEKQMIEAKAREVAGKDNVINQLTVVPSSK